LAGDFDGEVGENDGGHPVCLGGVLAEDLGSIEEAASDDEGANLTVVHGGGA
jgi:hypothetical protein